MCLNGNVGFDFAVFFFREEELWASMQSNRFVTILFAVGLVVGALTSPRSGEQLYVARIKGVEHSLNKEGSCYIYCNGINSTDSTLLCSPGPAGQPTSS